MRVVVLVPDRDVVLTRIGDTAAVSVDALDDRSFTGTLARVAQAEDAEQMMRVEIDLPNPDGLLYDGMYGKATITLGHNPNSLALPPACVVERSGRSGGVVYVARDGIARRTEVKLGGDNGSLVEVLSGLKPGRRRDPALGHAGRGRDAHRHGRLVASGMAENHGATCLRWPPDRDSGHLPSPTPTTQHADSGQLCSSLATSH